MKLLSGITGAVTRLFTRTTKEGDMPAVNDGSRPVRFDAEGKVIVEETPAPAPAPVPEPAPATEGAPTAVEASAEAEAEAAPVESAEPVVLDLTTQVSEGEAPVDVAEPAPSLRQQAIAAVSNLRNRLTDEQEKSAALRAELDSVRAEASVAVSAPCDGLDDETFQRIIAIATS